MPVNVAKLVKGLIQLRAGSSLAARSIRDIQADGPVLVGIEAHALSEPATASALEMCGERSVVMMACGDDGSSGPQPAKVTNHGQRRLSASIAVSVDVPP